jgi:hypothetical protein
MLSILTPKAAPSKLCLGGDLTLIESHGITTTRRDLESFPNPFDSFQGRAFATERSPGETPAQAKLERGTRDGKLYSNSSITISGFDPSRSGGPHVPAPLEVKTCIFPIRLNPYTNCR